MRSESVYDGMYGLCIGDAVGVPAEFKTREEMDERPIDDMTGWGTHYQRPGTWSDDSSLSLCLLDSLAGGIDYLDIMEKFRSWDELGEYTPYGKVFDIGMSTDAALDRYIREIPVLQCGGKGEYDNGNGSLMRILPIAFYIRAKDVSYGQAMEITADISSLTHAHMRSRMACCLYVTIALHLLDGMPLRDAIASGLRRGGEFCREKDSREFRHYDRLMDPDFGKTKRKEINSSGYVVDTLEAAVWCLLNTTSFRDSILMAVNLGDDTDTTASVTGGLAGIAYTREKMDKSWIADLARKDFIDGLCEKFIRAHRVNSRPASST